MNNELVSVVMCTYNGLKFIEPQLKSIQQQTYENLEIIICDDASYDGTAEWLNNEATMDNRIKFFKNEKNIGYNKNFEKACVLAQGAFVAISDQDDIWELSKIDILVKAIKAQPEISLVHCISARFEEQGNPHMKSHQLLNHFSGNDARAFLLYNNISGHNMLFKKSLLLKAIPFPAHIYYDWWLVMHACASGIIKPVKKILVWHRMHGNNATGGAKPRIIFYKQTIKNLQAFLTIKGLNENFKAFAENLLGLYNLLEYRKSSVKLFRFILKNAPVLFAHKKRLFPWVSYAKHAYKLSKNDTLA